MKRGLIVGLTAGGIGLMALLGIGVFAARYLLSPEAQLAREVNEINATLPKQIDPVTQLVRVSLLPPREVTYYYSVNDPFMKLGMWNRPLFEKICGRSC